MEVAGEEAIGHFVDFAFHEAGEVVEGALDAVIGDAVLRIVVGADFFFASTGADEAATVGGVFGGFFLLAAFEEAGAEDGEGLLFVFDLAATVLTADNGAGGDVEDLDGGVGGVNALAAGTGGAADFDADFVHVEIEVDFFGFWKDGDGGGGGVDAALGFGGGDALDTVDAAFVFEDAEDVLTGDFGDDFFEAADFGGAGLEDFGAPAAGFGEAGVHAEQIRGEEGGFVATGAGADFEEGVATFEGVGREDGELDGGFEFGDALFESGDFFLKHGGHVFVA